MIGRLLEIDREKLDLELAASALVAVLLAVAFEAAVGVGALQTGVAALLVAAVSRAGDLRTRMTHMAAVTVVGGALGFISYVSAETAWQAALVLGVVAYVTGLAYGVSPALGRVGYLLLLWTVAVLIGEAHGADPPATAAAFLVGGVVAMVIVGAAIVVQTGLGRGRGAPDESEHDGSSPVGIGALVGSDLGLWSLLRAVLTVVAVLIGYALTSDLDPFWTAIALLIVFQPDLDQTLFKAAQRGVGTLVGALTAAALLEGVGSDPAIVAITLIATFGAVAFYSANYMIYAFCLTNAVLLYYGLAADDELSGASQRVAATIIGIALAVGGMAVVALRARHQRRVATPT